MRGTFANVRLRNDLVPGREGPWTTHLPDGEPMTIYDAAMRYQEEGVPLVVLAGRSTAAVPRATGPPRGRRSSASAR